MDRRFFPSGSISSGSQLNSRCSLGSMDTVSAGYGYIDTLFSQTIRYLDTFEYFFSKNNTMHMRYKIKENKQQYSMRTHFKGFKHDP
jgi:hypothetical protein